MAEVVFMYSFLLNHGYFKQIWTTLCISVYYSHNVYKNVFNPKTDMLQRSHKRSYFSKRTLHISISYIFYKTYTVLLSEYAVKYKFIDQEVSLQFNNIIYLAT